MKPTDGQVDVSALTLADVTCAKLLPAGLNMIYGLYCKWIDRWMDGWMDG